MATTREKAERLLAQIGLASQHQTSDDFMGIAEICQAYLNPWIPVEERLPEHGQKVIAHYVGVYDYRIVTYWEDSRPHFGSLTEGSQPATHWMPLPNSPKE